VIHPVEALARSVTELEARGRSARRASSESIRHFPALYRAVVAELAERRAHAPSDPALHQLEALVLRAHGILYRPPPAQLGPALGAVLRGFPRAVRATRVHLGLATALLLVGALWGFLELLRDPSAAALLLPGSWEQNAEAFRGGAALRPGHPAMGAFYFTNNARAALTAYALGATFGVGTALLLLFNGVILGATVATVSTAVGRATLLSFVAPHAGVELAAILIAAAAGFRMAEGMIRPGWSSRLRSFGHGAREALPLAIGSTVLLVVAGLVEGWISPQPWPLPVKLAIGGVLNLALLGYLLPLRRGSSPTPGGAGLAAAGDAGSEGAAPSAGPSQGSSVSDTFRA